MKPKCRLLNTNGVLLVITKFLHSFVEILCSWAALKTNMAKLKAGFQ